MASGKIGVYHWGEFREETPELTVPDAVRELSMFVRDLHAVNVSWDSGLLKPSDAPTAFNWQTIDGFAVSGPLNAELTASWPRSCCGFDEWYFFRALPQHFSLHPFCNWAGTSIVKWKDLCFPGGFDLGRQLEEYQPEIVIGEGNSIFVMSKDLAVVERFLSMAKK